MTDSSVQNWHHEYACCAYASQACVQVRHTLPFLQQTAVKEHDGFVTIVCTFAQAKVLQYIQVLDIVVHAKRAKDIQCVVDVQLCMTKSGEAERSWKIGN